MEFYREVEKSIIKKYRKEIWSKFVRAVKEYNLIQAGDKIAVCISGGKDSMLMAKCMQELKRHGQIPFELEFLVMDPGYHPKNRKLIEENAQKLNIPIHLFESNIFEVTDHIEGNPCYLCARMRRGCLYSKAKELGCNKIALGHHFDDVTETIVMSLFYGAEFRTMMPKLHSTNFEGMELIRPLYLIKEQDIISWKNYHSLQFLNCACRLTENTEDLSSKRKEIKEFIKSYKKINPNIDINIFRSVENVNLNTLIGYHDGTDRHHFLDDYDKLTKVEK